MNNDTTFKNAFAHWIAAKWWADKLRSGETPSRNYTRSVAELDPMEAGYVMLSAKPAHYPDYQIDAFEAALATVIQHELETNDTVIVASDYGAGHLLREACKIVEMPNLDNHLPWKTVVWVQADEVQVREGYGAPVEIIWERKAVSDDEVVVYIAATITKRKLKVQPPNAIVHNQRTGRVTDSATLRKEADERKAKHKPKPDTSHGGVKR